MEHLLALLPPEDQDASFDACDRLLEDDECHEISDDLAIHLEAIQVVDDEEEPGGPPAAPVREVEEDEDPGELPAAPVRKRAAKFQGPFLIGTHKWMEQTEMASESTEKKMRPMWGYWKAHCESIQRSTDVLPMLGLNLYEKRSKDDIRNSKLCDRQVTDGFFIYLVSNAVGKTVLGTAKTFLNTNLKCEHCNRQKVAGIECAELVEVKVGESIRIKNQVALSNKLASGRSLERCEDLQAELDECISPQKNREMLLFAFKPKEGGEVQKLCPSYRFIFPCAKNLLDSTLRRSEELKPQRLIQRSSRSVMQVGPRPEGTPDETIITNKAKHNKEGRLEVTKALPPYDPLKCSSAWHGLYLMHRIVTENEAFPDWLGDDCTAIYNIRTCKGDRSPLHIDDKEFSQCHKANFNDASVVCMAVCHISRHQGTDEMDKKQLPESTQRRMTGHKGKEVTVHQRSHNRGPPVAGLVERAGGDPFKVNEFDPPLWNRLPREEFLLSKLTRLLIPKFVEDHEEICRRYEQAKSIAERKEKRLCTIKGTLGWILYCVEQMFLMLACPLVDPITHQLTDDKRSLWSIHKADALSHLLMLPPFQSAEFAELQSSVLAKMERAEMVAPMRLPEDGEVDYGQVHRQQCLVMQQQKEMLLEMRKMGSHARNQKADGTPCSVKRPFNQLCSFPVSPTDSDESSVSTNPLVHQQQMFLADGKTKRRRNHGIRQQDAISAEYKRRLESGEGAGMPLHLLCDKHCITWDDHINFYLTRLKPLEVETNGEWRKDIKASIDGKKTRNRSQWFTQRSAKFHCHEHLKELHGHDEAMQKCREKFESVPTTRGGKRAVKKVNEVFKRCQVELQIWSNGRPKANAMTIRGGGPSEGHVSVQPTPPSRGPAMHRNQCGNPHSVLPRRESTQRPCPQPRRPRRPSQRGHSEAGNRFLQEFPIQLSEAAQAELQRQDAEMRHFVAKEKARLHQANGDCTVGGGELFEDADRCFVGPTDREVGMVSCNALADLSQHNRENRGRFVEAQYWAETGGVDAVHDYDSVYDVN